MEGSSAVFYEARRRPAAARFGRRAVVVVIAIAMASLADGPVAKMLDHVRIVGQQVGIRMASAILIALDIGGTIGGSGAGGRSHITSCRLLAVIGMKELSNFFTILETPAS